MQKVHSPSAKLGTHIRNLETPCVVIDLDVLERNVARMARVAEEAGVALRPMVKTHKSSYVTNLQRRHGSRGFLAATVAEAEALVEMGVDDVVLA
jgi:D-serine deaminase-like pyridoxal phosphate-dependent protein